MTIMLKGREAKRYMDFVNKHPVEDVNALKRQNAELEIRVAELIKSLHLVNDEGNLKAYKELVESIHDFTFSVIGKRYALPKISTDFTVLGQTTASLIRTLHRTYASTPSDNFDYNLLRYLAEDNNMDVKTLVEEVSNLVNRSYNAGKQRTLKRIRKKRWWTPLCLFW